MSGRRGDVIERTTLRQVYVGQSHRTVGDVVLSISEPNGRSSITFVFSPRTANAVARKIVENTGTRALKPETKGGESE